MSFKGEPQRLCAQCGAVLVRRRYPNGQIEHASQWATRRFCSRDCWRHWSHGERHWAWKGDAAADQSKRCRAERQYEMPAACQECGDAPAEHRHHRDGNTGNNAPDNIYFVCQRCHMTIDGRLDAWIAQARSRDRRGTRNPQAILNDDAVIAIRRLRDTHAATYREIAALFGVSPGVIYTVATRRSWRHVSEEGQQR